MSVEIIKNGNWDKAFNNGIESGTLETCIEVMANAKALSPVDNGRLRNSLQYKTVKEEGGLNDSAGEKADRKLDVYPKKIGDGYVGSSVLYSIYQEFGTRYMKPQPFIRPSIDMVVKGTDFQKVLAKIQAEEAKGPLKEGQTRVRF